MTILRLLFARWVPYAIYPVFLGSGLFGCMWAQGQGYAPSFSVFIILLIIGAVIWGLEWCVPHTRDWRPSRHVLFLDFVHSLVSSVATSRLVEAGLLAGMVSLQPLLFDDVGPALWPSEWPLVIQLIMALLVGEFGTYWAHRLCHLSSLGWKIHAVHHSLEKLHWLAAGRIHPLNTVWVFSCQMIPLFLLGVPQSVMLLVAVFTGINGYLQHANVMIRAGALNWLISTSELHRWHHSKELNESNSNFGSNLIVWDLIFGTYYHPTGASPVIAVGISGSNIPENYWAHLVTPWRLDDFSEPTSQNQLKED